MKRPEEAARSPEHGRAAGPVDGTGQGHAHAAPAAPAPPLAELGFALLAAACVPGQGAEADWLRAHRDRLGLEAQSARVEAEDEDEQARARAALATWLQAPPEADRALHALARHERLSLAETMAIALARACELEPMAARALIWLQHPVGEARPSLGLLASLCERLGEAEALSRLADGPAQALGLIQLVPEDRPLCERSVRLPLPIVMALGGHEGRFAGVENDCSALPVLAPSTRAAARRHADGLARGGARVLVIRAALDGEARAAAAEVAAALGARPAFVSGEVPPGLGPWLWLRGRLPVLCLRLAPGDRQRLPALPGHRGPVLVASGADGSFEAQGAVAEWRLAMPPAEERRQLWQQALGDSLPAATLDALAGQHRHGAGRIVELGQAARSTAARAGEPLASAHVAAAARSGVGADLGALAELLEDDIDDDALVLVPTLRQALDGLLTRCRLRDTLVAALGAAARSRYRPGVRALLVGPSGTGKTLAAGWIATRLGLPLYRVDLASVTSKYIGETEKNLSELFARAEHAEVVLLFDEADSLFGKRTDVKDANDRFANQQTNYLLQRIESFEGIVLLTSNSRARFDPAFTRRLDAILEFPTPGPEERRALWLAHLGDAHSLDAPALNRLAAACDLAGGHIRNVVLAAAARARLQACTIGEAEIAAAVAAEYRKLGKPVPAGIERAR
ncbi:ATP-binding protein [Thauera sp.]|uniref:ATP-binding protein n=1 Tax=Thauera sp. TaxID=1905334 RepID=UPI002B72FB0A|nr:ATP-binding protein [Thauera sp.]HRP24364.1 ATP-binding protein [Thauera sp.]